MSEVKKVDMYARNIITSLIQSDGKSQSFSKHVSQQINNYAKIVRENDSRRQSFVHAEVTKIEPASSEHSGVVEVELDDGTCRRIENQRMDQEGKKWVITSGQVAGSYIVLDNFMSTTLLGHGLLPFIPNDGEYSEIHLPNRGRHLRDVSVTVMIWRGFLYGNRKSGKVRLIKMKLTFGRDVITGAAISSHYVGIDEINERSKNYARSERSRGDYSIDDR